MQDYKTLAKQKLHSKNFNKDSLVDISAISIPTGDTESKMSVFLQEIGNPYLFRVGDIGVHVLFSGKEGDSLQKRVYNLLAMTI